MKARAAKWPWMLPGLVLLLMMVALAEKSPSVKTIDLPDDNSMAKLKPGPGADTTEINCMGCHSTDYIVRQPRGDAEHWRGEVNKMIKVFGASISDEDANVIVNYLSSAYGPTSEKASDQKALAGKNKAKGSRR